MNLLPFVDKDCVIQFTSNAYALCQMDEQQRPAPMMNDGRFAIFPFLTGKLLHKDQNFYIRYVTVGGSKMDAIINTDLVVSVTVVGEVAEKKIIEEVQKSSIILSP